MSDLDSLKPDILKSIIFMSDDEDLNYFVSNSKVTIEDNATYFGAYDFTFKVSPHILKVYYASFDSFRSKIRSIIFNGHGGIDAKNVFFEGDWKQITLNKGEVRVVKTPWQEINDTQQSLIDHLYTARKPIEFQNIGNTARHLLKRLADIVFDETKHHSPDNDRDLGVDQYINRIWAFVLYKFKGSGTKDDIANYIISLLKTTDKGIALSNAATHAMNADVYLAQTVSMSTIAAVHIIKVAYKIPDQV